MITLMAPEFDPTAPVLRYSKGDPICFEGDPARYWFEVLSGTVRTCRVEPNGRRQLTSFLHEGDVFGVEENSYRQSAEAATEVKLRRHRRTLGAVAEDQSRPEPALRRAVESATLDLSARRDRSSRTRQAV